MQHLVLDDPQEIPDGAFSNTSFVSVSFRSARSAGVMGFGHGPWSRLSELHLPSVTTVEHDALRRNQYLVKVSLPEARTIADFGFDDASRLEVFDAPQLRSLGRNALNDAHILRSVNLPWLEYLWINCFDLNGDAAKGTGLTELRLPRLLTIDKNAVTGFASLRLLWAPELRVVKDDAVRVNRPLTGPSCGPSTWWLAVTTMLSTSLV